MEKIIFNDGTEIEIVEGASLGKIEVVVDSFADLEPISGTLLQEGNLDEVKFSSDDVITGVYENLVLSAPLYVSVDHTEDGKVIAAFSLREKTDLEKRIDAIEESQLLQDGAIADLGEAMSSVEEGGAL